MSREGSKPWHPICKVLWLCLLVGTFSFLSDVDVAALNK
jgi:hypothetical protein